MDDLDQLVSDAKLVAGYLSRMGLLGASPLPGIILNVEDLKARNQPVDQSAIVSLTIELSNAIAKIYPITLVDLGTKWRPFGAARQSPLQQFLFAAISIIIIVTTIYCTQIYIRANDALAGLISVQQKDPLDKSIRILTLYKSVPSAIAVTPGDQVRTSDFQFEPFLQSYEELQNINDQLGTYTRDAAALDTQAYPWLELATGAPGAASNTLLPGGDNIVNASETEAAAPISTELQSYSSPSVTPTANNPSGSSPQTPASAATETLSAEDERAYFLNDLGVTYIATMTSKTVGLDDNTINGRITDIQSIVEIYGTMILPVLYGLLGTIVFEMRRMLNPLRPNTATIRIVVRVFLGGLTGLVIAFLFKPLQVNYGNGQFAGAAVFLVAFLMGFSIDVFFATLDGLVQWVSRSVTAKTT
jgi:hypothetical protein